MCLSNNPAPDYYLGGGLTVPLSNNPAPDYYLDERECSLLRELE